MSKSSISQPVMHLCRTRGVHGLVQGGKLKPWGGLGHRETIANRHPPVEPAMYHRGSPTVVGGGWGA